MRALLIRLLILLICVAGTWTGIMYSISRDFEDRYYYKFNYECGSMITGISRALQGLNPDSIDPDGRFSTPFLNFGFTHNTSSYGEVYYEAIRKKINSDTKNGLFILEVNPLSVYSVSDSVSDSEMILGRMRFFSMDPNFEYVLSNGEKPVYSFLLTEQKKLPQVVVHRNGWNEYIATVDSTHKKGKIAEQYASHEKLFPNARYNGYRLFWLNRTINLLKQHGTVILVRMPVSPQMIELENRFYPEFDQVLAGTANRNGVEYWSYYDDPGYEFYDIHHMTSVAANRFSRELGERISRLTTNK
ncbi:MAG TPA: hypothetical protein VK826_19115 [Bacteroidia bacterium]|nr:hypothetical protein [Bacteroidia bacterium]